MSAATKSRRQNAVAKKPAKRQPKAVVVEPESVMSERSQAISVAMRELAAERTEARAERNGKPAKHCVFDLWFASISKGRRLDVEAVAAKYPEVKPSTVSAWCNAWRNLSNLPSVARGKEKQIAVLLKKLK